MRYSVFISYNHRDRAWASWLHRELERYRIPKALRGRASAVGVLGDRLPPVFQDREELPASADLARSVQDALAEAACLVVICSPDAAHSRWVNEEVRSFIDGGRGDRVQCLVVGGNPGAALGSDDQCFPPALLARHAEPLAADARPEGDGKRAAVLKLLAGIIGVGYDDLRQREAARRHKHLVAVASASIAGSVVMAGLTTVALVSRSEAVRQRDIATRKTLTAERTTDFVKGLFEVSDPSEAKGARLTALEVLDRGARQIKGSLAGEQDVRAELATTLGEVYLNLGFFRRGDDLVRQSLGWPVGDPVTRVRQLLVLGDSQTRLGDYPAAIGSFNRALQLATDPAQGAGEFLPRLLIGRGEALAAKGESVRAGADIARATKLDEGRFGADSLEVARDLEAAGLNADFGGDPTLARRHYQRALAIRIRQQGEAHPRVSEDLSELGSLAYSTGDAKTAETYWQRALRSDQVVLGPDHPDVAATLNNIARLMLERRAFREALPLLRRSIAINLKQRDATHDDLAFIFANLGIAERGVGDLDAAETDLRSAMRAATLHKHRNLAPILTDLAEIRCARGAPGEGLALLAQAAPLMRTTYPEDPWRSAWVASTTGYCQLRAGKRDAAAPLLKESAPIILAKWPPRSLYGAAVVRRAKLLAG